MARDSLRQRCVRIEDESITRPLQRQGREPGDRINAICTQENKTGVHLPAPLQNIDGAEQVVFHELPAGGTPTSAGKHAGVSGRIDHPIDRRKQLQIVRHANVTMNYLDTQGAQDVAIHFAAASREVVDTAYFDTLDLFKQSARLNRDQRFCDCIPE